MDLPKLRIHMYVYIYNQIVNMLYLYRCNKLFNGVAYLKRYVYDIFECIYLQRYLRTIENIGNICYILSILTYDNTSDL